MSKIRIAFVKFGGLAAGGTEKLVQSLAASLNRDDFKVDFFWCHGAPYTNSDFKFSPTDPAREQYMRSRGVNLIEFKVAYKDIRVPTHDWLETDFWEKFDEKDYDIVVTGRAGHPEYPFYRITNIPIVDVLCLAGHLDRQPNIVKSVHISEWQKNEWLKIGGDPGIAEVIPIFDELPPPSTESLRTTLGIDDEAVVFGFHQRDNLGIFSPVPLKAYSDIVNTLQVKTAFVLLGGSRLHREQAKDLDLKTMHFLEHTGDQKTIGKFLKTLDVYAHGRADGETAGLSIIEAMQYGMPVVSHTAPANGHIETVGPAGKVCVSMDEYTHFMKILANEKTTREYYGKLALERYQTCYAHEACIAKYESMFKEVYDKFQKHEYAFCLHKTSDEWLEEWLDT